MTNELLEPSFLGHTAKEIRQALKEQKALGAYRNTPAFRRFLAEMELQDALEALAKAQERVQEAQRQFAHWKHQSDRLTGAADA